ncbi:MAG: hypothetical protein EHM39_02910 [Chloroflexi bacterium]|nr:MAG: hypothetical protein EHM39_02910 [Chloroflexota bacterium]
MQWAPWGAGLLAVLIILYVLITRVIQSGSDEDNPPSGDNRTWLEYAWTSAPVNENAVQQLGERLGDNAITMVYLEASAWRTDGTLLEGQYAADFARSLRDAYPNIKVLLWLRMSGEEIAQDERRATAVDLARKAVSEWDFDGVQLNARTVLDNSDFYIQLVRDLRGAAGDDALLSLTVPPDRVPTDPDVPADPTVDPGLTWGVNYKQRVGLLGIDEVVVMAHASGLSDADQYETWVAYQVESYVAAMAELDRPPAISVALPTYDAAPDHDPAVEDIRASARGVKAGINQAGRDGRLVRGVGLYEYKSTDSLEWVQFSEHWLGRKR